MFDKEYFFHGRHAERVTALTNQFGNSTITKLFQRNIDVYLVAPLIGFLYGRKADQQVGIDRTINFAQMTYEKERLVYNYRLIMLLDENYEPNVEERLNKAFRYMNTEKATLDEQLYDSYVRGGVDVLFEKLIENSTGPVDYINSLFDFLEEFDDRYNKTVSIDDIAELCKLECT